MAASPTEGFSPETLSKFKLLQQRFVLGLPARWMDISAATHPAARQDALHRLAGGAGSYGFERLSQLAHQAENQLMSGDSAELAETLVLLKSALESTLAGAPPGP